MRNSFNLCIAAVIAYVVLVTGITVFPTNNNNNLLLLNTSNQIAHATAVGMYNYTRVEPTNRVFMEKANTGPPINTPPSPKTESASTLPATQVNTTNRKSLVLLEIAGASILDWSNEPSTRLSVSPNQAFQGPGADCQPSSLDP